MIRGGKGDDVLRGGELGFDILFGDRGDDTLYGDSVGPTIMIGGYGSDTFYPGAGIDFIHGGSRDDEIDSRVAYRK